MKSPIFINRYLFGDIPPILSNVEYINLEDMI